MGTNKKRRDGQKSGLAGEFFVAAELLKRDYQVSLTLGNAKAVDLFVQRTEDSQPTTVQVKTLRSPNCYLIRSSDVHRDHIYVFVLLHKPSEPVEYFVVAGSELCEKRFEVWGKDGGEKAFAGITIGRIRQFKDKWTIFEHDRKLANKALHRPRIRDR